MDNLSKSRSPLTSRILKVAFFMFIILTIPTQKVSAAIGNTWTFNYTGNYQTWVVPSTGTYKIEVWGAEGGHGNGGYGGYSTGTKNLTQGQTIQIYVGGSGANGGYNGGGKNRAGRTDRIGGGATDVRIGSFTLNERIIVAGGGGSGARAAGGAGGGINGGDGLSGCGGRGTGGTQTTGGSPGNHAYYGSFGVGGDAYNFGGGGGGGYYGGGGGGDDDPPWYDDDDSGGGGGSGYIGGVDNGLMSVGSNMGNGRAAITALYIPPSIFVSSPAANQIFSATIPITLSGTVNDADVGRILKVCYRIDGSNGQSGIQLGSNITANGANQSFAGNISVSSITDGSHTLYAWVQDDNGNKSSENSTAFKVDNTSPTPGSGADANIRYTNAADGTTVRFQSVNGSDNLSGVEGVYWYTYIEGKEIPWIDRNHKGTAWNNGQPGYNSYYDMPIRGEGKYIVRAHARDNANNGVGDYNGNTSWSPSFDEYLYVDRTAPTGSIVINGGATITDNGAATLTLSASDTLTGVKQMIISNNGNFGGASWEPFATSRSWNLVTGNNTIYVKFKDQAGNESSTYSSSIKYDILPTLNTPALSNEIYRGFDMVLSSTGTGISSSAYRIFYTTKVTVPPVIDGGDNPGIGWIDSGIAGAMNITGTTNVSNTILASTFDNIDWTYVVFKISVGSSTGNWITKYTVPYNLSNPNDEIGYVGHNQIITINETGNKIVVSSPTMPVNQYGPYSTSDINKLAFNNIYKDGDPVKYRVEFDVAKPSIVKSINVYFDYNYYNKFGVETEISQINLQKLNSDGTIQLLKTFTGIDIKKENTGVINRYFITIDKTNISDTPERYFVEYSGYLHIQPDYTGSSDETTNNALIEVITQDNNYGDVIGQISPNRKFEINTKIIRSPIKH